MEGVCKEWLEAAEAGEDKGVKQPGYEGK